MDKKRKIAAVIAGLILLVLNGLILCHRSPISGDYQLCLSIQADQAQIIQVYFSPVEAVSEDMSSVKSYDTPGQIEQMKFAIPQDCNYIRLDLGKVPGSYKIENLVLAYGSLQEEFSELDNSVSIPQNDISSMIADASSIELVTENDDPYLLLKMPKEKLYPLMEKTHTRNTWILNILVIFLLDGCAAAAFIFRKKVFTLPVELIQNRGLILSLAKNDFKTKYAGSYLGIVWAFVQPVVTILVYWFVFSIGLKAGTVSDYPFVLYLVSGIVPWFFFQDALNGGTNALIEYNYLVKKVVFKISILPIVKIISALFVHLFFVAFSLLLCWLYGYAPGLPTLQILYYTGCTFMLTLGLVYATSAIVIFFRDLTQIINIFLQVGVWMTPIMWDLNRLADHPLLMKAFKLNPMYYIVSGYRDAMLTGGWVWEHWGWSIYFWVVTVALFGLGTVIFKRLKPHFADVL